MSRRNMEVLRRWVEARNARDIESMIAYFDPRLELDSAFAAVGGGVCRGHAGLRSWVGSSRTGGPTPTVMRPRESWA